MRLGQKSLIDGNYARKNHIKTGVAKQDITPRVGGELIRKNHVARLMEYAALYDVAVVGINIEE